MGGINKELAEQVNQELLVLEKLKVPLGRFFAEVVYQEWGLIPEDVRLVDEAGFGYTGLPIFGPELLSGPPHIDIAVLPDKYKGPTSEKQHPLKILFPMPVVKLDYLPNIIMRQYHIDVSDLIKGKKEFFNLRTKSVSLYGTDVLIPDPVVHIEYFARDTILFYNEQQVGSEKILEWFYKLIMLRGVANVRQMEEVEQKVNEMINLSINRWHNHKWFNPREGSGYFQYSPSID